MSELEQTKKVLDVIANLINEKGTCTYRHLIYDLLEFKEDAYSELISGLTITNFLVYVKEQDKEIERLNNRIDKAIEYIENVEEDYIACERSGFYEYQDKTRCLNYEDVEQKLYNILRGEDNE